MPDLSVGILALGLDFSSMQGIWSFALQLFGLGKPTLPTSESLTLVWHIFTPLYTRDELRRHHPGSQFG